MVEIVELMARSKSKIDFGFICWLSYLVHLLYAINFSQDVGSTGVVYTS